MLHINALQCYTWIGPINVFCFKMSWFSFTLLPKGRGDNETEAEKGGWISEGKHQVQTMKSVMGPTLCYEHIPCSAFFLILLRMDLSFLSRDKNLGSYILPYGKWHGLLELFYSVKLSQEQVIGSPTLVLHVSIKRSISGVSSRRWTNNSYQNALV